jgi:two-component system response regulator RegA
VSAPIPLLLVDDDEANLLTLGALLEVEGFDVVAAASADEARDAAKRYPTFALAIVDLNLDGWDGLALATELRSGGHAQLAFILSGDPPVAGLPDGIDGWFLKGGSVEDMIGKLRAARP